MAHVERGYESKDRELDRLRAELVLEKKANDEAIAALDKTRADLNDKSNEIVELQTELHRLRPVADQVDEMRAKLAIARKDASQLKLLSDLQSTQTRSDTEEITRLRAELELAERLQKAALELRVEARSEADALRAELDEIECRYEAHIDQIMRHNAEEIARLRGELHYIAGLDERVDTIPLDKAFSILREMGSRARAALAQEEPSR